ncbi:putative helicase mov-10-B.1 [Oryzias melastigma]|uniref:Putative helicase mov-10-B.1 n=1 Tax=Oryzias melastigma TaxID=30732 RepID=A0A834F947_ORYME|nr:putative helicase mov-10-B.1 [Oryzias melastigma]
MTSRCSFRETGLLDNTRAVLAGDPKQLGPVVISKIAEEHGLGVSLLERLMRDNYLYKPDEDLGFDSQFITKLLKNYRSDHGDLLSLSFIVLIFTFHSDFLRSHPSILKVPNDLFYNGELQPCACPSQLYKQVELLPREGFPVVFHGVAGISQQLIGFPSLYNRAEIQVIKDYLKSLIKHFHQKNVSHIQPGETGIISPYGKQVDKIQMAIQSDAELSKENLENVEVGTVDKFHGKEFSVILMSTGRTFPRLLHKPHFSLGFVKDERRFNVAMTRARYLLIVVGDPRLLVTEKSWNNHTGSRVRARAYSHTQVCSMTSPHNRKAHSSVVDLAPPEHYE